MSRRWVLLSQSCARRVQTGRWHGADLQARGCRKGGVSADSAKDISPAFAGASLANAKDGGVEVTDVVKGSMAQRFGLRKGDVITGVNKADVKNLNDLKKNLEKVKGQISAIRINRNGGTLYITLR